MNAKAEDFEDQLLSLTDAAQLVGRSPRWVQGLAAKGTIRRGARGQYRLYDVVRGAISHEIAQSKAAGSNPAANRVADARAKEIHGQVARKLRGLISLDEAEAALSVVAQAFDNEAAGLAARIIAHGAPSKIATAAVQQSRATVAKAAARLQDELKTGIFL